MPHSLYGLILAGGKSTRMGRDKGLLVYHQGKNQIQYLNEILGQHVEQVHVSIRRSQSSQAHLQAYNIIEDARDISSPLNGILSAMDMFPNASWLVAAVDMPFINETAVHTLLKTRNPELSATCFSSPVKKGVDPLFAIWEAHAKGEIEDLVVNKLITCPRNLLSHLPINLVQAGIDTSVLRNINTPQEYRGILS